MQDLTSIYQEWHGIRTNSPGTDLYKYEDLAFMKYVLIVNGRHVILFAFKGEVVYMDHSLSVGACTCVSDLGWGWGRCSPVPSRTQDKGWPDPAVSSPWYSDSAPSELWPLLLHGSPCHGLTTPSLSELEEKEKSKCCVFLKFRNTFNPKHFSRTYQNTFAYLYLVKKKKIHNKRLMSTERKSQLPTCCVWTNFRRSFIWL